MEAKRIVSLRNFAAILLAVAILWICLFSGLSATGLVGPDEPRYAWIARNMAQTGDWVTPRLYGQPWFEKPILYYWAAAVAFKFIHSPEWAARFPSSLAALAAALAMAWLAWRRYGASTAWAVLVIFPTCFGAIGFARAAAPDMLFAASLALAMVCAATVAQRNTVPQNEEPRDRRDLLPLMFLGACIGAATLAKGPAAILLAGGSVVLWAPVSRQRKTTLRMLHPLAILSFAIVALPWYVLCAQRNPDFFRVFIVQHNFGRYLTPEFHHRQPFWYFIPIILIGVLPWTALLGGAALDARRVWREKSLGASLGLFAGCWAIFPVLFFSFSQSKLPGYILPAIPPLALLMARSFVRQRERVPHIARWLGVTTGVIWLSIAIAGPRWIPRLPAPALTQEEIHLLTTHILMAGVATGAAIIALSAMRKFFAVLAICAAFVAGLTLYADRAVLSKIDPYISARAFAKIVPQPLPTSAQEVPVIGVARNCEYGVRFYRPEIQFVDWTAQTTPSLATSFTGFALVGPDGETWLSPVQFEERHFVRGFSSGCWIEFLVPKTSNR